MTLVFVIIIIITLSPQLHLSNTPTPGLPGLEDVGITPCTLEEKALTILRRFRDFLDFDKSIDEIHPVEK